MGYGWKVDGNSFVQKSAFSLEDFVVMTKLSDTALLSLVLGLGDDGTGGRSDWLQYITKVSPSDRQRLENEKSAAAQNDSFSICTLLCLYDKISSPLSLTYQTHQVRVVPHVVPHLHCPVPHQPPCHC